MKNLCTLLSLLSLVVIVTSSCSDDVSPCHCRRRGHKKLLECSGPIPSIELSPVLQNIGNMMPLLEVHLDSLELDELVGENFKTTTSLRITKCRFNRLMRSIPRRWLVLKELELESVVLSEELLSWDFLESAENLRTLYVNDVYLPLIGENFQKNVPSGLQFLELKKTQTIQLEQGAFSYLNDLLYLSIMETLLESISREVLPTEMPRLHTLILSNNRLRSIDADFFQGMPKVEVIMLSGNRLSTLDLHTFQPVIGQLQHLLADSNPLICNCTLHWLLELKYKALATCYDPIAAQLKDISAIHCKSSKSAQISSTEEWQNES